jgi:tyrosyl-tRNA synthetase
MSELSPFGQGTVLDELWNRGFIKQSIRPEELEHKMTNGPIRFYIGFDPTGDCLHVGHLLPIMCMAWLQKMGGHHPIIVLGGGTAMVGDPSGKDKTREMLTNEKIQANLEAMRPLFGRFVDLDNATMLNNADWLQPLNYINFLRDIGRHFSVNTMIKAEGARQRLERGQGYSFIEFNYHLLQSYDFLHLFKHEDCILQVGGDDQWFHFTGGAELIRKETGKEAFAFTIPLLATSDGKKMGKTEKGAVWIEASRLSVYDYYQYWVNVTDADVIKLMKLYTFMPLTEIADYAKLVGADIREAKHKLALEATALAHGMDEAKKAQEAAKVAFSGGQTDEMPSIDVAGSENILDLLVRSDLCKSKGDARRQMKGGAIKYDAGDGKQSISDIDFTVNVSGVLWFGKKRCVRVEIQG